MYDASEDLWTAATLIRAIVLRLTLITYQRCAAFGTLGDILKWSARSTALRELYLGNLRDNLAALLDIDHIAEANV